MGSFIATFSKENSNLDDDEQSKLDAEKQNQSQPSDSESTNDTIVTEQISTTTQSTNEQADDKTTSTDNAEQGKTETEYTNFIYWRNSLPNLDDTAATSETLSAEKNSEKKENEEFKQNYSFMVKTSNDDASNNTNNKSSSEESMQIGSKSPSNTNQYGQIGLSHNSFNSGFISNLYSSTNSLYSNYVQPYQRPMIDLNQLSEELKQVIIFKIIFYFIY